MGKTATVYALAHEMGFKVLEVNASATRNGRQVLANLREATQSHDVRKQQQQQQQQNKTETETTVASTKKHRQTALILFEDIDLTFDEVGETTFNVIPSGRVTRFYRICIGPPSRCICSK